MPRLTPSDPAQAVARFFHGRFVMTACYDDTRAGVMVHAVQPCAIEPLLVSVSVRKGHSIEPLIRDSHAFAICALDLEDKLIPRKFAEHEAPDHPGDPFDSLPTRTLETGSPVLERATVALDCEVVRHFDLEADHELYVGHVVAALTAS